MAKDKNAVILDDKPFWDRIGKSTDKIVNQGWKNRNKVKSKGRSK